MKNKMKLSSLLLVALALVVIAGNSEAGRLTGKVEGYLPYSSGTKEILIFKITNNDSLITGCNATGRFAIDDSSTRYKTTVAAVISSYHAKTPLTVDFSYTCNMWVNSFDVNYLCVGDINC